MKIAYLKNQHEVELRNTTLPDPAYDQIAINVDACGICGTDVTAALDGSDNFIPFGHEIAGTITALGPNIKHLTLGQKVALDSSSPCGHCANCKNTRQDICSSMVPLSFQGFAQAMVIPAITANPYQNLSPQVAALAEPLGVAIDMVDTAQITPGDHVLVSGIGPIGLMAITLAKRAGAARIYVCTKSHATRRNQLALQFGADELICADQTPLENVTFTQPPHRLLVTSPPKTIPDIIKIAAPTAVISFIGIKYGDGANITFDANLFHFKKLQLRGAFASPALKTPRAISLLETGIIDGPSLISHTFPLSDIAQAVNTACTDKANVVKVMIVNP